MFMEDISDRVVKKFLEVKNNVSMNEFIETYIQTRGENAFSFLLGF